LVTTDIDSPTIQSLRVREPIEVRWLGPQPYAPTRDAMITFTAKRDDATPDEFWLLEHPPVYTLGQAGRLLHLHGDVDIPVVRTERGGQITYHGPGQLVAYLLIDLRRRGIKVREFVQLIEASVIELLAAYNLPAQVKAGAPGVYVMRDAELQKVAALGLKIVNGRSFHGLSLNIAMDLAPYARIDACGYPGLKSIDMASLGVEVSLPTVGQRLAAILSGRIEAATAVR
jgi:lipoyl(octanoyl) transferase